MEKVWLVEQGYYSDYRVVGVFSSKENAQRICSILGDASIDEREVDPVISDLDKGYVLFHVSMLRDGTVESIEMCPRLYATDLSGGHTIWRRSKNKYCGYKPDVLNSYVMAKDSIHAIKIVNEHRTQLIATNQWK